jgi:hypothetical protein
VSSDMKIEGYGCEVTLMSEIERIAIEGLLAHCDPYAKNHRLVWDGADMLWQDKGTGSYVRFAAKEHRDDVAFGILALLRGQSGERLIDVADALTYVILAEIEYAKTEAAPGSTLTRSLDAYEDEEARVSLFVTTTLKKAPEA